MGDVDAIRYSGSGWVANIGQSHTPVDDWPRFEMTAYDRTISYDHRASYEIFTRRQGDYPALGGGTPLQGEQQRVFFTYGEHTWTMAGDNPVAQPANAEVRQLDIWMSPHGFLKAAAEADDASATALTLEGRPLTIVSFTALGQVPRQRHDQRGQPGRAGPDLGAEPVLRRHDLRPPLHRIPGVRRRDVPDRAPLAPGRSAAQSRPQLDGDHGDGGARQPGPRPGAGGAGRRAGSNGYPPVVVRSTQMAPGVWRVSGGSHHSIGVEFDDFLAVVEAPQSEARSLAVIAELRRRVPEKPIRYVVNTHHHVDHAGGLRTYVAQSAAVVTHEANRDFYMDVFLHPGTRSLEPDILSSLMPWFSPNRIPALELVSDEYTLTDGERVMNVHAVPGPRPRGDDAGRAPAGGADPDQRRPLLAAPAERGAAPRERQHAGPGRDHRAAGASTWPGTSASMAWWDPTWTSSGS